MPRQSIPLAIADLSQFSRALGAQLAVRPDRAPSHLSLLNMLARAAGFRNFQHLRAGAVPAADPHRRPRPRPNRSICAASPRWRGYSMPRGG
ncbi:hypothetical protein ACTTAM_16345 [Rhodobacter capsulatus]|uniref:hypothetical protein n=1 Tax=Rhodobacter capsulatus TaxID=1061 RepID=UPI004026BEC1